MLRYPPEPDCEAVAEVAGEVVDLRDDDLPSVWPEEYDETAYEPEPDPEYDPDDREI